MGDSGQTTVDFGAFPGSVEASVDVAGQAGLISTSEVEAWLQPVATADHSVDEHLMERIKVNGYYKVDGTLTIVAKDDASPAFKTPNTEQAQAFRLYGQYTVGWVWN